MSTQTNLIKELEQNFFQSLEPFKDEDRGVSGGFSITGISPAIDSGRGTIFSDTQEIRKVVRLFQKAITIAQEKGLCCGKVAYFDDYTHLNPEKVRQIERRGFGKRWEFAAIGPTGSLVHISDDRLIQSIACRSDSWQAIYPIFLQFLKSSYGIKCVEIKQSTPVDACDYKLHLILKSFKLESIFQYSEETGHICIAKASELRVNSHEYILSWGKNWEPKASPDYPFPQCAVVNNLIPNNMKFLFDDCAKRQFTDIEITCQSGVVFHAHRLVLIAAGDYFKTMLTQKMQESLSNKISFSEYDSNTVETFLKFLYLEQDPFSVEGADSIDAAQLLALSHLCQIEKLTQMCANHIGQNIDENQWKEVGQLGANFQNKYLLQVYECYRNRKGKPLTKEMSLALQKYAGIDLPPSPCAKALVHCDVGYGNSLGLFCHPLWDAEFPSRFIWKEGKWKGHVPINTDFKFVLINSDNSIKWENRITDRKVEQPTSKSIAYNDVKFK